MSLISPVHLLFFAAIALIVLGPKRLPELARALGAGMREFRDMLNGEAVHARVGGRVGDVDEDGPVGVAEALPPAPSGPFV